MKRKLDTERVERMRGALEEAGLDALVLRLPENITLLAGYYPLTGFNFLLFPRSGDPVLIVPASEQEESSEGWWPELRTFEFGTLSAGDPYRAVRDRLASAAGREGAGWRRIGCELGFEALAPALLSGENMYPAAATRALLEDVFGAGRLVDAADLLHRERALKTGAELDALQTAHRIADIGLAAFFQSLAPGRTEAEIAGLVTAAIMKDGVGAFGPERVLAFPQVCSGAEGTARAWRPCVVTGRRALRDGDLAVLELGVVADGFWADVTRTGVAGRPTARQVETGRVVAVAQAAAEAACAPGVPCCEVDRAARSVIERAGLGERFIHVTGHGLGFRYHEPEPLLHPANRQPLAEGMVFSVEPGVYIPSFGGVRIENNVALARGGRRTLTSADRLPGGGAWQ